MLRQSNQIYNKWKQEGKLKLNQTIIHLIKIYIRVIIKMVSNI